MNPRGPFPAGIAPFDGSAFRVRMGLRRLDLADWLEIDSADAAQRQLKRDLYRDRYGAVVVASGDPAAREAALELHALIDHHLVASGAGRRAEPLEGWDHPIAPVGLSTQEDWCVMVPGAGSERGGDMVLGCASVCFPTRWVLGEKLGRTISGIHASVPLYEEQIGAAVDGFFDRLTVDRPVWRVNWNLCDDEALHQPYVGGRPDGRRFGVEEVGEQVWLRLERQTLRRLPATGAIAFGIRVHHQPLGELAASDPVLLERLRAALAELPPEVLEYKGLAHAGADIDAWRRDRLGSAG